MLQMSPVIDLLIKSNRKLALELGLLFAFHPGDGTIYDSNLPS
jgi:hypothetical protein